MLAAAPDEELGAGWLPHAVHAASAMPMARIEKLRKIFLRSAERFGPISMNASGTNTIPAEGYRLGNASMISTTRPLARSQEISITCGTSGPAQSNA